MGDIDGWANIHHDILKEIAKHFYSYHDFIQLRLVCKQWSLKLPEISSEILWLLVPEESSSTHVYEDEEIYHLMQLPIADEVPPLDIQSLDENEIHHLKLPEMQNKLIRGSFGGWLIVQDIYPGSMYMLNAFTKVYLDLPPVYTFPDIIDYNPNNYGFEYSIWSLDDDEIYKDSSSITNSIHVWKVIINSCPSNDNEDFMAVAIYGPRNVLAFYKPNDKRWLDIDLPTIKRSFDDVICFGDKRWLEIAIKKPSFHDVIFSGEKIYALEENGQLYEFDTKTKSGPVGGIHEAKPPSDVAVGAYQLKYLVGCANGSLLMLVRHFDSELRTYKFDIYELKKNAKEWSRLYSLENYVLMIGFNSSVQMLPASIEATGNQIYFTDNLIELKSRERAEHQDIGIFDLDDGSCQTLLSDVKFMCPPVWCYSSLFL